MPASWVAASVKARLIARRRIGSGRARELSKSAGLSAALQQLAASPYSADLEPDMPLVAAQRHIAATVLWNTRLIGGWLPPGGAQILQPLAAWFELANIEERLVYLEGGEHPTPYQLGGLAIAWPAVSRTTTPDAVRAALKASRWGDPGSGEPGQLMLGLRFRWARWVSEAVPEAAGWAATASELLGARVRAGVDDVADLWNKEAHWWSRLRQDAARMLVHSRFEPGVVVGAVALLAYDAWLVRAALAAAARGDPARSVFDAIA